MGNRVIRVWDLDGLHQAAQEVLDAIGHRRVVALYGAMGVGKTTLIKALCHVLGVEDQVNSPTFTLINEYQAADGLAIYHFDFYRIKKIEEVYDLGYYDYFDGEGLCLIEWPEMIEALLPMNAVRMYLRELTDGMREIEIMI